MNNCYLKKCYNNLDNMPVTKVKKVPMTTNERQKKYLENPGNMDKHKARMRNYYLTVTKPKRDAKKKEKK